MVVCAEGAELFCADGWTDGHGKDDVNFSKGYALHRILWFIDAAAVDCQMVCLL
jgi:hypothetical protein